MNGDPEQRGVSDMARKSGSGGQAAPINTGVLLREMVDLRRLAEFPDPAFRTIQFSSYDRLSALPGGPGWFANNDGFGGEETPNFEGVAKEPDEGGIGEYVICDVEGPGAIVRTWSTTMTGSIRLYLDDAEKPLCEGPAQEFLARPYRTFAEAVGIAETLLDGTLYQRDAGYCPMPFAKRCRMIWIGNLAEYHFYHVQIRRYEPGAEVITFQPGDLRTCEADIQNVARVLSDPDSEYHYASTRSSVAISGCVPARQTQEVLSLEGPQVLERLALKVEAQHVEKALRQTILHVICDDHPWGQVQAPVGDFFGAAPGINPFSSLPFTVLPDGTMTCRYVMPFKTSVRILIDNRGEQPVTVTGSVLPRDYAWNDETSLHFCARWRVNHDLVASNTAPQDMPFLIANGRGVYVGTALMMLNPAAVPTPHGGWWGEGDEKIFVDDDTFPSTFGTGSEDYFNYGWSAPDIFGYPYCGQPRNDGPGNRGFVTNHRWHVLDCLPFQERIAFYMELFSHERTPGFSHARIGYHYARPGVMDDHTAITDEDVRHLTLPPNWQPAARLASRDTVFYHAEELTTGRPNVEIETGNLWANSRLLVWHPSEQGAQLALRVPILEDGRYAIKLGLAMNGRSGRVSVALDGKDIGFGQESGVIDLHVPHRVLLRQHDSDTIELAKGEHMLAIRFEGPLPEAGGNTVGINYVAVQERE